MLDRALDFIEDLHLAEVVHTDIEIVELPTNLGDGTGWDDED